MSTLTPTPTEPTADETLTDLTDVEVPEEATAETTEES